MDPTTSRSRSSWIALDVTVRDLRDDRHHKFDLAIQCEHDPVQGPLIPVARLLSALRGAGYRPEGSADVYVAHESNGLRQRLFQLEQSASIVNSDGSIPLNDKHAIELTLESRVDPMEDVWDERTPETASSPFPSTDSDASGSIDIEKLYEKCLADAKRVLATLPPDASPGVPRWTPEELARHDMEIKLMSEEELEQLEALRWQELRKRRGNGGTVPHTFEFEYGTDTVLQSRLRRPWEHIYSRTEGRPPWLQTRQLKKNNHADTRDLQIRPVYPTIPFSQQLWHFPDNSIYSREQQNQAVVEYLKTLLVEKDGYWEFVESKGRSLPILDLLRQYYFANHIITEFTKIRCPPILPVCGGVIVTKENVLAALDRRPSWGADCAETLDLVYAYGTMGERENQAVKDAIEAPIDQQIGSVQFLKLLRAVHREWERQNAPPATLVPLMMPAPVENLAQ